MAYSTTLIPRVSYFEILSSEDSVVKILQFFFFVFVPVYELCESKRPYTHNIRTLCKVILKNRQGSRLQSHIDGILRCAVVLRSLCQVSRAKHIHCTVIDIPGLGPECKSSRWRVMNVSPVCLFVKLTTHVILDTATWNWYIRLSLDDKALAATRTSHVYHKNK